MKRVGSWVEFVDALGPHITKADPIEALRRDGVEPDGVVVEALAKATPTKKLNPALFQQLQAIYGPPPATRVHVGRGEVGPLVANPIAPRDPPPSPTGYRAIGSVDLSVLNDILAELWRVRTIPAEFDEANTQLVITLAELRAACTGVPDDALPGKGRLTAPPIASASNVTPRNMHFDVTFELPVVASVPASLAGVFRIELPLDFFADVPNIRLSSEAIQGVQGALEVAAWSTIRPRSEEARVALQDKFTAAARKALLYFFYAPGTLAVPLSIPIAKKKFPNSTVDVAQLGAVSVHRGGKDFVIVGINVEAPRDDVDTAALATQAVPLLPDTLHAAVGQDFATDALSAVISSGDLAAFFTRVAARNIVVGHVEGLGETVDVRVNSGRVVFDQGRLRVSLDCVAVDACSFNKDLHFKATVSGTPSIENGTLAIATSEVDFDLDNSDAVICALLSGFLGPASIIINVGVLAFLAGYNPQYKDVDIPVAGTSEPLPGSDKVVDISLTRAAMTPGFLTSDGYVRLITDTLHTFVHLRLTTGVSQVLSRPLVGATVELFELDSPAPSGDDVNIPAVGETEELTPKFLITTVRSYSPRADEHLGTGKTDGGGNVRFVAVSNAVGGTSRVTRTRENLQYGTTSITTVTHTIGEAKPDLGVTVRTASGTVLATRRLVGLNVPGNRLGTLDSPVVIYFQQTPALEVRDA